MTAKTENTRRVLFVSYDYPLIGAAGVIRTYQLAKDLKAFGWEPIILTAQTLSADNEQSVEASNGHLNLRKVTAVPSRALVPFQANHRAATRTGAGASTTYDGIARRMARFAGRLAIPDGKAGWMPAAVNRGREIAADFRIEMCFSVSPRPTSHLVARRLARSYAIPWVADFALPWSDAHWLSGRLRLIRWLDQKLERSVLSAARHVTVAYPDIARGISARHGASISGNISVIPTGYDEDLFDQEAKPTPAKFTVFYPGNHFCEEGRSGDCFLRAADEWMALEPVSKETVEFVFMGKPDDELLRHRADLTHPEAFRTEPLNSHRACIRAILSSHACLVNAVDNRIPAKVYECMRAGKWILALTARGSDLEALMRQYPRGVSVPSGDTAAIRKALQTVFDRSRSLNDEPFQPDRFVETNSCRHSAAALARIFDELLLSRARSRACQI